MSKIQNLTINSAQRVSGNESQFTSTFAIPIMNPDSVAVENVQLYNTQYSINSNNCLFPFRTITGCNTIATIPQGNYTPVTLSTAISTYVNLAALAQNDLSTYICNYSNSSYKYNIQNTSNNFNLNFDSNTNSIAPNLGYSNICYSNSSNYNSPNLGQLNNKYYYIYSDMINTNTTDTVGSRTMLAYIPNVANFGDLINTEPKLAKSFKVTKTDLSRINFIVYDQNNKVAQLNGVDWSMNLVVSLK